MKIKKYSSNPLLRRFSDQFSRVVDEREKIIEIQSEIARLTQRFDDHMRDFVKEISEEILASDVNLTTQEQAFLNIPLKARDKRVTLLQDLVGRSLQCCYPRQSRNTFVRLEKKRVRPFLEENQCIESLIRTINNKARGYFEIVNEGSNQKIILLGIEFV